MQKNRNFVILGRHFDLFRSDIGYSFYVRAYACSINIIEETVIFLPIFLHMSKKSCTFAGEIQ